MLTKIREKSQGVFAWVILVLICVPFALWGIQNYVGGGSETAIASVGDKDFYQQDVNRAYAQYSQNLAGMKFDENVIKKQALEKLIQDEVLLQHVEEKKLVVTDNAAKNFIKELDYFQTDDKYDNKKYKSLLAGQRISSGEFVSRIKKALVMEQFQRAVIESGFATQQDIEKFFKIQNQTRDVEVISIGLQKVDEQSTDKELEEYYQQNQNSFLTEEQVSIEYVELSLDELATQVDPSSEQLQTYYEDQKELYTTQERRKISHILFAFTEDDQSDKTQLERASKAKQDLSQKDFSGLAAEISDDKLTALKGGDLGLFNVGVMEKAFEAAATSLKLDEVSEPIKSSYGYHLIKVTELVESEVKPFDSVKDELKKSYQRSDAETLFYELGETLTEVSYENPDSLQVVADALTVEIKTTELFGKTPKEKKDKGNVVSEEAVVNMAFSEDVLKGNNSEPIELGSDRLIVLRMLEHKPAELKDFNDVKTEIIAKLLKNKAIQLTEEKAIEIKKAVVSGKTMQIVADENGLEVKKISKLSRGKGDLALPVNQAVFKAAKPDKDGSTVISVADRSGSQTVVKLLSVIEGVMSESDKAKQKLAVANMSKAFGQADFKATLNSLRTNADIRMNIQNQQ